jgi:hypothetical protein
MDGSVSPVSSFYLSVISFPQSGIHNLADKNPKNDNNISF